MVAPANVKPPSDAPSADEVRSKKEAAAAKQKADLSLLEKESARVEKKLRLSATETIAAVDGMIADVRRAREKLTNVKRVDNTGTSVKQVLVDLVYQFPGLDKYPERVRPILSAPLDATSFFSTIN
ncbi:hypothetical protein N9L76_04770 [bacterium]|jgi:hypothetical protein|nr:hypothetical protein [bacterium]|tara:strand:+ start:3679 stop:4056 length:378 start_codon:yes stop_codon:yes gene_type:complete